MFAVLMGELTQACSGLCQWPLETELLLSLNSVSEQTKMHPRKYAMKRKTFRQEIASQYATRKCGIPAQPTVPSVKSGN